ncbi:hypothetical protein P4C99_01800 [Pontiellaceae bacterium B1224]|nr:hypothetical protein [Pontiellaceae bacterium B1224]
MKRVWICLAACLLAGWAGAGVLIKQLDLSGGVSADELALEMKFEAEVEEAPVRLKVLDGAVAPTATAMPKGAELILEEGAYYIDFTKNGRQQVSIGFEAKVIVSGQRRGAEFGLPPATIRRIELETERAGYKVKVVGAPKAVKVDETHVQAWLPSAGGVQILWSPELEKLSGELVASCESILVGSAKVGALQLRGQYQYAIPQGRVKELALKLPDRLNVTQVQGADLLSWKVEEVEGERRLQVELSRSQEKEYLLTIQAEQALPEFPCAFDFPVVEPLDVIRANGVLLIGTDSTIKLLVDEQGGVTQVEPDAVNWGDLQRPKRGLYAYMFASMPFSMKLSADNIVTSLHAQDQIVLALNENEASLEAKIDLEVRDAPARDVELEVSNDWTVTSVAGQNVADYDVRDRDGSRWIKVYFKQAVDSRTLVQLRLEKTLPEDPDGFALPTFRVDGAKSERGFMVLRGEIGTRLEGADLTGLREVNTGSLPVRISDARQAFRFKRSDWTGRVEVRQESASVHAESFQLVSLGESGVFGSSLITYNIANAPTRSFKLKIPRIYRNVEVHGRDIRNWTQDGEDWTIHLKQKVVGDYTLLVTYDHPAKYQGEVLSIGGVQTLEVENETGYIALAGSANLSLAEELGHSKGILSIDVDEVPEEYTLLVNDPIMHAYKYVATPHEAQVRIKRFSTQQLLTQVADHITLDTTIGEEGEAVTRAVYHVKNTDQQYLPIRLPDDASLWSVKVNDAKIQVLDRGDGQVLIPVERRRDPNAPLAIEVTYAEQLNKPGWFTKMKFQSPEVDTQSVFARWAFTLPDGQRLASAKGNMEQPQVLGSQRAEWGALLAGLNVPMGLFWIGVCSVLGLGLFVLGGSNGYGKTFSFPLFVVVLCCLGAGLAVTLNLFFSSFSLIGYQGQIPTEWAFTKSVSGSDGGLQVQLALTEARFSMVKNVGLLLIGLIPVVWAAVAGKRTWLIPLLAALTVLYSFSPYLAWLTLVLPHIAVFTACYYAGHSRGRNKRNAELSADAPSFSDAVSAGGNEGFIQLRLLAGILCGFLVVASAMASQELLGGILDPVDADLVELRIDVPAFETETQVNVSVKMELEWSAEKGEELQLLGPGFILKDYTLSSKHLELRTNQTGSTLYADREDDYTVSVEYLVAASYKNGEWDAQLWIPASLRNSAVVHLPVEGWQVQSAEAIRIRQEGSVAKVLFSPSKQFCKLGWKPEERKTDQEQSRFFCDVNTLAEFRPGMVGLRHEVLFNIAQGELQNLRFDVPAGMSITEVHGKGIGTWRYNPEAGLLEVVLSEPATASYSMRIGAQMAREKLPYQTVVKGITVRDAVMQRGVLACAATDAVQIDVLSMEDLSGINIADASQLFSGARSADIKRAFRYNHMPFSATVGADEVLPELRLMEETSLDVALEQIRLSTRLNVTVSKSGIFALRIRIPEGFDVDSLSGEAVSHWDEVNAGTRELVVNFTKQVTGTIPLNLMLSRSGKDLEPEFDVPRIRMDGVLKHTGTLAVTMERGIRVAPLARDGVSEISPRELGIRQEGSLAYRLLRPDWNIEFQSEIMKPKIKVEVLQQAALSEGLLKVICHLQYDIEHAGVKTFRLQPPRPDVALVVSGKNVSRVRKIDEENGIWEVELHGKVETRYGMEVAYQLPFEHDRSKISIRPLQALGTESQKGYVIVLSSGRLQVQPAGISEFLRPEDARSIPRSFGAGDLSDAVLCYRSTERDYDLTLNVVRHNAADVLPAQVQSVQLDSVITKDGQSLNNMTMVLDPGSLRFLEMRLPDGAEIWSVFVNETAVRPLVEEGTYLIPMEPGSDRSASVEVMYAHTPEAIGFGKRQVFSGPRFQLPLMNVRWTFYAPDGYRYSGFDGTMQHLEHVDADVDVEGSSFGWFGKDEYQSFNIDNSVRFSDNAKLNIELGNDYMESGDQRNARKAFQKAITYSQGQQDLNEDARVQFRNLVRQQGVVGLVNRRNQLKQSLNQMPLEDEVGGNVQWSGADVQKIEAQLGEKESSALSGLAERMLDQQQAASVEVHPIRVVMARQGSTLEFERALQLQPDSEMRVEFRSSHTHASRTGQIIVVILAAGTMLICGGWMARVRRKAQVV